ncbi:hypothetical protein [Sulfuricurvum sp. RIFCSPLOWO2_12_FULL_43_24]|uniref:hypothetical protein n=1 Tax=Sulfuricurvum sp. RIFCSPLOWO2_12_FULL_43_24 TaxID=1802247 RepID=UPI0008D36FF3|nr:hypothetical protein [Sulfuricurvum sp. RIFCSPLOWO2_12_FULL_43_24]OHD88535.1 MAG: hypothetical protein A3G19_08710 [Sulfuricurvum sp. RIFCSPLOWO2_12_FULL_43_24]
MLVYHLEIENESVANKVIAFLRSLPENTVKLSKEEYDEELESLVDEGFKSPIIGTHDEVFAKLGTKYAS